MNEQTNNTTTVRIRIDDKETLDRYAEATHRGIQGTMAHIIEKFVEPELKKLGRRTDKSASAV